MTRLEKIKNLSWLEWRVIMAASLMLPLCALYLRLWGLNRTQEILCSNPVGLSDLPPERELAKALQIARAVDLTAIYGLYRANCLKRSLVLCRFLRGRGISCDLRIGADLSHGELSAHAWVEHAGVVLNDSDDVAQRFASLEPGQERKA
jgi:hypothetical protein